MPGRIFLKPDEEVDVALDLTNLMHGRRRAPERSCGGCGRTPVPGEVLSVFAGERVLCALCAGALPEAEREPLRHERVHASDRRLDVVARAA